MTNTLFPLVSIVVPTYNSSPFIKKCLDTVFSTDYPNFEIIIVDDISIDDTLDIIKKEYSQKSNLKILINHEKKLAAGSRNVGFAAANGEYVALLDHDVDVEPNWIREMVAVAQLDLQIGIVQSKVFDINQRDLLQCVGVRIYPQMGWVISLGFGEKDKGQYDNIQNIVAGATGVMYRKSAFVESGGFDEQLGINLDDLDLNWRMWVIGYKTVFAKNAKTYHWTKVQQVRNKWIKQLNWEFHYAKMPRVFLKNYNLLNNLRYLPIYVSVASLRGLYNLIARQNPSPILGLLKSLKWNLIIIGDTLKERNRIQKTLRKISDNDLRGKILLDMNLYRIFKEMWLPLVKTGDDLAKQATTQL
ncbi:MAG: glycosyltransferase family 2 protein [bacterium]|nr:glycosyltransferase family 2 protein [bacterium]